MTFRITNFSVDGLVFPSVESSSDREISREELCYLTASTACTWARVNGFKRVVFCEADICAPHYETIFKNDEFVCVSNTPEFFFVTPQSAAEMAACKNEAKLGDIFIVVCKREFKKASSVFTYQSLIAIVPWFAAEKVFDGRTKIAWNLVLPNINPMFLNTSKQYELLRCEKIYPLMPFGDEKQSAITRDTLNEMSQKLLAFLLRWQQTRVALHPDFVKMGIRACDRAATQRELARKNIDIELWRLSQQKAALDSRSLRFFGDEPPRRALFASPLCWTVLLHVVSTFSSPTLANFVISEMLDVLRFIIREEVMRHGELAVHDFLIGYLKEMCEGIAAAEIAHLQQRLVEIPTIVDEEHAPNLKNAINIFTRLNASRLAIAKGETLDMRVETIEELQESFKKRQSANNNDDDDDNGVNDPTALSMSDIEYLAAVNIDEILIDPNEFVPDNLVRNLVVVSHNFFCGIPQVTEVLYSREFNSGRALDNTVMKGGRRYMSSGTALETAVLLTRAFLCWHSNIDANETAMTDLEKSFKEAAPKGRGLYPVESHSKEFDDIAIGTDDFRRYRTQYTADDLRAFLSGRRKSLDLPKDFNMAENRGLIVPTSLIIRSLPRTGTLHSTTSGPVEIHRLALHTICHRERCYKSRAQPGAHLDIEYDTGGEKDARFAKLNALQASHVPLNYERLAEAVRSATSGNRAKLDDIEDVVGNMYENKALPLCVRKMARVVQQNVGDGYFKNNDRLTFYRMMRSFEAPEVTQETILRFMLKNAPAGKIGDQFSDAVSGWEKHAEKSHVKAAEGYRKAIQADMRVATEAEAMTATTCAPSCSSMINHKYTCPYLGKDAEIYEMLIESGVSDDNAYKILARRGNAGLQCKMQFQMSRPGATSVTRAFSQLTDDVFFKHPHQYMLAAADYLLRHKEMEASRKMKVD
jgi:hypothetical protein